jgi:hypothetical protein
MLAISIEVAEHCNATHLIQSLFIAQYTMSTALYFTNEQWAQAVEHRRKIVLRSILHAWRHWAYVSITQSDEFQHRKQVLPLLSTLLIRYTHFSHMYSKRRVVCTLYTSKSKIIIITCSFAFSYSILFFLSDRSMVLSPVLLVHAFVTVLLMMCTRCCSMH